MPRKSAHRFCHVVLALAALLTVGTPWARAGSFNAFGPQDYVRGTAGPVTVTSTFSVLNPNTQYTLKAFNGGLQDDVTELVSSGFVIVNGVQVIGPDNFNQNVTEVDVPLTLQASNTISVQVRGQPGGVLTIEIVGIDNDPPTITAVVSPTPNAAGWNNSNVTVTFSCSDQTSGVANCPAPQTVVTDGANQVISGTATDKAGNTASTSVTVNLDETPPSITATASPVPNAAGWNNTPVTVTFFCSDLTSGIGSCPQTQIVSNDGRNQVISGTATDTAGNTASASVVVSVDQTPPTITAGVSPAPNAAGWNNTNPTVTFTCTDSASGVATCPPPQTVTTEGVNQAVSGTAIDNAGNAASTSVNIKLDKTPPSVTIFSPTDNSTISLSTVSIALNGSESDNLSGVSQLTCNGSPAAIAGANFTCSVLLTQGLNSIAVQATDAAGNSSSSPLSLTFAPAPQITFTAPANLSITNITPVTVTGTVDDPTANITVNGITAPQSGGSFAISVPLVEGLNVLTAVATNGGGVASTATVQITLDTTPPHLTIDSPADGSTTTAATVTVTGLANDVVVGTVNAQDVLVSVNAVPAQVANRSYAAAGVPLSLGKNIIQATGRDHAGNSTTTSVTVTRVSPSQPPAPAIGAAVITQSLAIVSGNNQTGTVGTQLQGPLVVAVADPTNHPLPNQTVVFKVTGNNGTVSDPVSGTTSAAIAVTTDSSGSARALWTLGDRAGAGINTVQASSSLAIGTTAFTATAITAGASQIVVDSGNDQTGIVGQPLGFPFVADVVDAGHNRVPNVPVTFTIKQGGGNLGGLTNQIVTSDSNGRALVVLTLGTQIGNANNVVEATFPNNPGAPAAFAASARVPGLPANTTISGVVLDNSNNPIPGVTIRLFETNQGNNNNLPVQVGTPVQTDSNGMFLIQPAPVGFFKLMADGTTAQGPNSYPPLEYDIVTVAGNNNTVGMPIYLPALDPINKLCVDETHGGTLTLPQVPGFALTVLPGSATFPGGSRQGCVSVTPVNGDKVPMSPGFGQQPRFIVTIQPVGTTFNPPAPITLPNVDGLPAKAVTEMYSYDHDLGMFVAIGTGTVSNDGSVIASNAGVGVLKAGWHCGGNPNSTGSAGTCPDCQTCQGSSCAADATLNEKSCKDDGNACTADFCDGGNCSHVAVALSIIKVDTPSGNANPPGPNSFIQNDQITATAQTTVPGHPSLGPQFANQVNWKATSSGTRQGTANPATATGTSTYAFTTAPNATLLTACKCANPEIAFTIEADFVPANNTCTNDTKTITQDTRDIIRQEYQDFTTENSAVVVPDRSQLDTPAVTTGRYNDGGYPMVINGTMPTMQSSFIANLNTILSSPDIQNIPPCTCQVADDSCRNANAASCRLAANTVVVTAGTIDAATRPSDATFNRPVIVFHSRPGGTNVFDAQGHILAGASGMSQTTANTVTFPTYGVNDIFITSGFRNPRANKAAGSRTDVSPHTMGKALDIRNFVVPGLIPVPQVPSAVVSNCIIELAGDRAVGAANSFQEAGPTITVCTGTVDHLHIQTRP